MKKSSPWYYLKDTAGDASLSVTIVLLTFWTVLGSYIMSGFESVLGIHVRTFDPTLATSLLVPVLMTYVFRRYTEAKLPAGNQTSTQTEISITDRSSSPSQTES